jgi:hypothetical protein
MHNVAVIARMRIPQTDRFDTVLPKEERFFNSPPTKPRKATDWHAVIITGIIAVTFIAAIKQVTQHSTLSPAGVAPVATPAPPPPLPDPRIEDVPTPAARALPVPVVSAPRAQLLHIRAIGTFENDRMPDGRTLGTTYRGELPNPGALPRRGAQLGDMWYTRNDGHTWVLAPIAGGSQTVGWIDP